jgi:hypothetical protein
MRLVNFLEDGIDDWCEIYVKSVERKIFNSVHGTCDVYVSIPSVSEHKDVRLVGASIAPKSIYLASGLPYS